MGSVQEIRYGLILPDNRHKTDLSLILLECRQG